MADNQQESKKTKDENDLQKRLQVIFGLRDKINKALHKIYKKGDITHKQVSNYLDNPDNFPEGQWDYIQKQRDKLLSFIWESLGTEEKKKHEKKQLRKKGKKRRRKSIGFRRKWIQMD